MRTKKRQKRTSDPLAEKMASEGYVSVPEAARRALVSRATIYAWSRASHLGTRRVGLRSVYVLLSDLVKLCPHAAKAA